jgi:hypothetical protein
MDAQQTGLLADLETFWLFCSFVAWVNEPFQTPALYHTPSHWRLLKNKMK